ncbi:MAG: hypothetical protein R3C54_08600 [Parvularculaceae bacterium]|nr:hypothetical protein [Amphiplicatus sp.]HRX41064.1 hypothetical protein [Parvularculaceae bacterium]
MSMVEEYVKELAFGPIDSSMYDFEIRYDLGDVQVKAWPVRRIAIKEDGQRSEQGYEVVRDTSRSLLISFEDVSAVQIFDEGRQPWDQRTGLPTIGIGGDASFCFPVLRVENSRLKESIGPDWDEPRRSAMAHWRLISFVNCVDIFAREASGHWNKHGIFGSKQK